MTFILNKTGFFKRGLAFILENLLLVFSLYSAVHLRYVFSEPEELQYFFQDAIVLKLFVFLLVYQLCFYYTDCSILEPSSRKREYFLKIIESSIFASLCLFCIYYLYNDVSIGRGVYILTLFTSTPILYFSGLLKNRIFSSSRFHENVLIVGSGLQAKEIGDEILKDKKSGFLLYGYVDEIPRKIGNRIIFPNTDILRLVHKNNIKRIVVALEDKRGNFPTKALLKCKLMGITIEDATTFHENLNSKIIVHSIKPSWFIYSDGFNVVRSKKIIKRSVDVVASAIGLVLSLPLFLLVAIAVRLDSSGDIIFRQKRVGEGGKLFTIMKFRSMVMDAEKDGPVWARENDARITRTGAFIRKTRLDEIPQLINVLRGDMSLVGPRPERPHFVAQLRKQVPYYVIRLSVKPGVTGWAQINCDYAGTIEETLEKLQYDLYYLKHLGIFLDFYIIWSTIKVMITRKGAL